MAVRGYVSGSSLRLTEANYVMVRLLQRFDKMENLDPDFSPRHKLRHKNCSGNGVKVRLHMDDHLSDETWYGSLGIRWADIAPHPLLFSDLQLAKFL
jgi:hypothetical protein